MGSKPNDIDILKVLTIFMCGFFFMFQTMLLSFVYIIYFIQIFDHFSFRSVIFSSTSGIKNLELNVNKPPISRGINVKHF